MCGGGASQVHGQVGGVTPTSKPHSSVTDARESAQISIHWLGNLSPQQGADPQMKLQGAQRAGLLLSASLMPTGGECSTHEREHLGHGRGTQHGGPGSCSFSFLPRATDPVSFFHFHIFYRSSIVVSISLLIELYSLVPPV